MKKLNQQKQKSLSKQRLIWRLELNLYYLLEKANKEFSQAIKSAENAAKKYGYFKRPQDQYIEITKLIQHNRKNKRTSELLELYYLEALLGKLQSKQNDLNQDPLDKETVLYNDQTLRKIKKSLSFLFAEANKLNEKIAKTKTSSNGLLLDQTDLLNNIKNYFSSWEMTTNQLKATYYYNFAANLIDKADNINSHTDSTAQLLKEATTYLGLSSQFYHSIQQHEAEKQTDQFNKAIEKKLHAIEQRSQAGKRKSVSSFKEETFSNKRIKTSSLVIYTTNATNKDEINLEEKREQQTKETLEKSLKAIPHDSDRYACYSKLFFVIAEKLVDASKDSNHTLLTKLSWLTTTYNLMALSSDKNQPFINETKQLINTLHKKHNKTLRLISLQKRAKAYPTYSTFELQSKDLQSLFMTEVIDYYYGLNAFQHYSEGAHFLEKTYLLTQNYCNLYLREKNTLQQVESLIKVVSIDSESLFFAHLLRELVKFYLCSENKAWLQVTFSLPDNNSSHAEYLRLLKAATYLAQNSGLKGQAFIHKIFLLENHLSSEKKDNSPLNRSSQSLFSLTNFFQPNKAPVKTFLKVLKEHLQYLIKITPLSTKPDIIYETILKFIQKQGCLYQASLNCPPSNQLTT